MFALATGAIIALISLIRWNVTVKIGRRHIMSEVILALKILKEYCGEQSSDDCDECPLYPVCYEDAPPMDIDIPESTPEPAKRPRIAWLRMLPDDELIKAASENYQGVWRWWHKVVTLWQFRKDVGLDER